MVIPRSSHIIRLVRRLTRTHVLKGEIRQVRHDNSSVEELRGHYLLESTRQRPPIAVKKIGYIMVDTKKDVMSSLCRGCRALIAARMFRQVHVCKSSCFAQTCGAVRSNTT